jgi:predicted GNAT family acetyltransferase
MNLNKENLKVTQNEAEDRFEIKIEDHVAIAEYIIKGGKLVLTHTEVSKELEGNGIGGLLAKFSFQYARDNDLKVLPLCPFMAAYVRRHPEVRDVVLDSFK